MKRIQLAVALSLVASPLAAQGSPPQGSANQPYTMEYYYKVQWGHQQEFLQLFLKNHYPLLQKEVEGGTNSRGQDRDSGEPHDGGVSLGLPRHPDVQELVARDHDEPGRAGTDQAALARPGNVHA